ncbi:cyclic nucleotide-binding domain-containing protein [Candidatus Woesearchaeota archaeon]|nr:cyclic nucleotide-binding domain-containing protein [Candidatus Woesearchaeota archaeon]
MRQLYEFIFEKPDIRKLKHELVQSLLFKDLTPKEIDVVVNKSNLRQYKKGDHVFFQGDPGNALYVILRGRVEIERHGQKTALLASLSKGMFFGELSLVDDSSRSATAFVAEDAILFCIFKQDLQQLVKHHPRLATKLLWNLAYILGQRLRVTNERLAEK